MTVDSEAALALVRDLKAGKSVSDSRVDALFPPELRVHSKVHFTPVKVALRVRDWLGNEPSLRVLDVGSGCGKFCLVFAATGAGKVTGIEQRPNLHTAAEEAAGALGLRNASFVCGRMEDLDWRAFNVFYFFNPFYERIAHRKGIDDRTPPHAALYFDHIRTVRDKLDGVKSGSRVVTYHGMGGRLPPDWLQVRTESIHTDELQLWVKP
jgi:SAM-dependent methyltransferase